MSDPRCREVRERFDPADDGTVAELVVSGATLDDWGSLLTLIRTAGRQARYKRRGHRGGSPASAAPLLRDDTDGWLTCPGPVTMRRSWPARSRSTA